MSRYTVDSVEGKCQPSAEDGVLENLLGIHSKADIDDAEMELLQSLYLHVFDQFPLILESADIQEWHRLWLGNLYEWAGEYRSVNMSKGGFQFASATHLPALFADFERRYLSLFNDLEAMSDDSAVAFLAESHVEFLLIHPFREGNGRMSRLLLDVMAVQAGFQTLDYELWDTHKDYYIAAIQAGVTGDYQYMERLVRDVLEQQ